MDLENLNISDELREKAKACKSPEELLAFAKAEGYKLSDAEMDAISGGSSWSSGICGSFMTDKRG
ncbi:MAG: Nif11-like leader peptide family natural product precursor [Eggerthellaceae bacterium]|nr:Nif11-like leader peptide family natural product precursor [Eggerthellaceae bacterium]